MTATRARRTATGDDAGHPPACRPRARGLLAAATLAVLLLACAAPPAATAATAHPAPAPRPVRNVVVILADDLGWRDLGCTGSTFYDTPNLDRLAASGVRFTEAYAAAPVCSPTRAAILTGRSPARLGTTDWFGAPEPEHLRPPDRRRPLLPAHYVDRLPADATTLAETLRAHGYATFFAGKWHLGGPGSYPEDHGFDVNVGGWQAGGPYGGKKYFSPYGNPKLPDGPPGEHLPDRLARETARFVREHADGPFLAYLSFYSVHTPLMGRPDLVAKYEARRAAHPVAGPVFGEEPPRKVRLVQDHAVYAAMVEAMDQAVGVVLDALDEAGVADDTLVVFTSDNGGLSTSEGSPTSNQPLRAGKGWLYEGGIREPAIVRWPGVTPPGTTSAWPLVSMDVFPTVLEALGLPPEPEAYLDGRSFAAALVDPAHVPARARERPLYWHYPHYGNQGGTPSDAVRQGDWKLLEHFEDGSIALYDLAHDPGEHVDVAAQHPAETARLTELLRAWRDEVGALLPQPNPAAGASPPAPSGAR